MFRVSALFLQEADYFLHSYPLEDSLEQYCKKFMPT